MSRRRAFCAAIAAATVLAACGGSKLARATASGFKPLMKPVDARCQQTPRSRSTGRSTPSARVARRPTRSMEILTSVFRWQMETTKLTWMSPVLSPGSVRLSFLQLTVRSAREASLPCRFHPSSCRQRHQRVSHISTIGVIESATVMPAMVAGLVSAHISPSKTAGTHEESERVISIGPGSRLPISA